MERVLVVDDSPDQARSIAAILQAEGYATEVVDSGEAALDAIEKSRPDLVLTDLRMPGLDGLQLVERIVQLDPVLPVVLMTAYGNGEIAMRALNKGAASYLPKRLVVDQLAETVEHVLELTRSKRERERLMAAVFETESRFVLGTDPALIPPLISYVEQLIGPQMQWMGDNDMMRVSLALQEALLNAVHHGNLEVDSAIRETSGDEYLRRIKERASQHPYRDRKVFLTVSLNREQMTVVVEDQGPGFDVSSVPDPKDPENLLRSSGRGLCLIGNFMDSVEHNAAGNKITMTKTLAREPAVGRPKARG